MQTSDNKEISHSIYVSLDCLLDTRLGTLSLLSKDLVSKALADGYIVRDEENFPPLKKQTFLNLYNTRNKEVLKESPITPCVTLVTDMAMEIMRRTIDTPVATGVKIVINTHPYKLNDKEALDLLTSFADLTKKYISLKLVSLDNQTLTPSYCQRNFSAMIMYNYDEWLEVQATTHKFKNNLAKSLIVYAPRIFFNRKPTFEEKRKMDREKIDPFKVIEEIASFVIDLKLLDIGMFSVDVSRYVEVKK